jgi:hypothetical protein
MLFVRRQKPLLLALLTALAFLGGAIFVGGTPACEQGVRLLTVLEASRISGGQYWGCNNTRCKEYDCTGCVAGWGDTCQIRTGNICGKLELTAYYKADQAADGFDGSSQSATKKCGVKKSGEPEFFLGGCSGRCTEESACGDVMWLCTEAKCGPL